MDVGYRTGDPPPSQAVGGYRSLPLPSGIPYAVAAVAVEILAVVGLLPRWAGLAHEVALPPLDLVSDLGALLSRSRSVPWFVIDLVVVLAARSLLLAWLTGFSRRRLGQAFRFYLVALVPALAAAALVDSSQTVLYSLVFWAGMAVAVAAYLVLAPVAWREGGVWAGLWASIRQGGRIPTLVVYLVALTAISGLARLGGGAGEAVSVPVAAFATWCAARHLSRPGAGLPVRLIVLGLVAGAVVAWELVPSGTPAPVSAAPHRTGSLLLVAGIDTSSGYGTMFDLDPATLGYRCAQTYYYSYAGTGRGTARGQSRCPITTGAHYTRTETERPLATLVSAFRAELARIPGPVTVVAHSSGSWVAWAALAGHPEGRVRDVVLLAPLADPLGYPGAAGAGRSRRASSGAAAHRGQAGYDAARIVTHIARQSGFSTFTLSGALATEVMGQPSALAAVLSRPLPGGERVLAVPAAYDLPLLVGVRRPFPHARLACVTGTTHSSVVTGAGTARLVDAFLSGRDPAPCRPWQTWPGVAGAGFLVPPR